MRPLMFSLRTKSTSSSTELLSRLYRAPFSPNAFMTGPNRLFLMMYLL